MNDERRSTEYDRRQDRNEELARIHDDVRAIREDLQRISEKKQDKLSGGALATIVIFLIGSIVAGVTSHTITTTKLDALITQMQDQSRLERIEQENKEIRDRLRDVENKVSK